MLAEKHFSAQPFQPGVLSQFWDYSLLFVCNSRHDFKAEGMFLGRPRMDSKSFFKGDWESLEFAGILK